VQFQRWQDRGRYCEWRAQAGAAGQSDACYIVCAYLTGMRDSEVQAMRAGCLDVQRSEDGLIERYRIKSTVYKGREVRGQAERWITIEPVSKAITVLERLTEHIRRRRGSDTL
jgi:integrase